MVSESEPLSTPTQVQELQEILVADHGNEESPAQKAFIDTFNAKCTTHRLVRVNLHLSHGQLLGLITGGVLVAFVAFILRNDPRFGVNRDDWGRYISLHFSVLPVVFVAYYPHAQELRAQWVEEIVMREPNLAKLPRGDIVVDSEFDSYRPVQDFFQSEPPPYKIQREVLELVKKEVGNAYPNSEQRKRD